MPCARAGAYVSGAAGSSACPAGSVRIETEAVCRAAATAVGKTAGSPFGVTSPIPPRGCYYSTITNTAYFNAHAVGAGNSDAQPLCAATVTTGAPLTRRCATRVYCAVLAGGASNNANGLNIYTDADIRMCIYTQMWAPT